MFRRAHDHKGAALVEIFQNCNVFNDGAFSMITKKDKRDARLIDLEHGKPIRFGADAEFGVAADPDGGVKIVEVAEAGVDALLVHDETRRDPSLAFALSRLSSGPYEPTPVGVFRAVERAEYTSTVSQQLAVAQQRSGPGDLRALLHSQPTWEVG